MVAAVVASFDVKYTLHPFGVSTLDMTSMGAMVMKLRSKYPVKGQGHVHLGSPRKVQASSIDFPPNHCPYVLDEPIPIKLSCVDNLFVQPPWAADAANIQGKASWVLDYPQLLPSSLNNNYWNIGPALMTDAIRPPPGLEGIVPLIEEDRSSSAGSCSEKADSVKLDKPELAVKCTKHGLHICNRMFGGRKCQKADCFTKSSLCHEEECCANRVRPRPTASEKQAAKAMARLAKAELENLELSMVAKRVNDGERGLGYKLKALEILQHCAEPENLPAEVRACVVEELRKTRNDASAAYRVQESARKILHKWDDSLCEACV